MFLLFVLSDIIIIWNLLYIRFWPPLISPDYFVVKIKKNNEYSHICDISGQNKVIYDDVCEKYNRIPKL